MFVRKKFFASMFMSRGGGGEEEGRFVIIFIYKGREVDFVAKDT